MEPLDVNATALPIAQITNQESAERWVEELIQEMLQRRHRCDVPIPDNSEASVKAQQRAMWSFLTKHGEVIGALKTLVMCGLLSDNAFKALNQRAINALVPSVVGGR